MQQIVVGGSMLPQVLKISGRLVPYAVIQPRRYLISWRGVIADRSFRIPLLSTFADNVWLFGLVTAPVTSLANILHFIID